LLDEVRGQAMTLRLAGFQAARLATHVAATPAAMLKPRFLKAAIAASVAAAPARFWTGPANRAGMT
jgi:hypothetical protein